MLELTPVLFALAALGGLTLAIMHIRKSGAPMSLSLIHGLVAAAGLILLILAMARAELGGLVMVSVVLFVVAAVGGLMLLATHLRSRPLPAPLIVVHGLVAAAAFAVLLSFLFM